MKGRLYRADATSKPPNAAPRTKKRSRRTTNGSNEYMTQSFAEAVPIYPGLFSEENGPELPDELLQSNDMSLKGQIWPGMGKMDLANEDMKRTRNQRKPKSAIDKMRRTSEGIEPTQVVLTSDFQVERVKGVYDSSSPIPGQEETTPPPPKRPARARKKREPLSDLSTNTPIGHSNHANANLFARTAAQLRTQTQVPEYIYTNSLPPRQSARPQNIFRNGQSPLQSNPLLSHERPFFKSYIQSPSSKSHEQTNSFSGFKAINYGPDITESTENVDAQDTSADDIKVESQLCDIVRPSLHIDNDEPGFDTDGTWSADTMLDGLRADLDREGSAV
ncbi:hypothetical protein MY3296_003576 [Beauveria thailandica]